LLGSRNRASSSFAASGPCQPPAKLIFGVCVDPGAALPGGDPLFSKPDLGAEGGEVVMGRYGAGMVPIAELRQHRECLSGMILGDDGICYNRADLKNSEREYPRGRAPLLTGGERNAITKAARAARKIERTTKSLQKMGMLKKPTPARRVPVARRIAAPAGTSIINVE